MDRQKMLGSAPVGKLLLKFSIPAIVGMLVNALYNTIDRIYIGRKVGELGIAGITIGFPIMIIIMAFGMLIGIGATSLISIKLGEDKKDEAEKILGNGTFLLIIIALIVSALGLIFLNPLLKLFGASETVLPYSKAYLQIILAGSVFQTIGFGMNNFIRAEGNPKIAMFTMLIGAVLNIILDPIFIFVFDMGVRGAAIATILSQAVAAIWVLSYFFGGRSTLDIHISNFKLELPVVGKILAIGSAPFLMQVASSGITALLNNNLQTYGGDTAIAAFGIINSITMFILMPIFGINQGAQPIIGYNYGAKQYDRVKSALKLAILAATSITVTGYVATRLFPKQLISLFGKGDMNLVNMATEGITIFLFMLPIIGFQIVSSNYFQAVGKPKHAMFLSLSRQVLFLIPAILIIPRFLGLKGVWMAAPVADSLSSLVTGVWIMLEIRKLNNDHNEINNFKPIIEQE
ncbi:MATE family efflux transporter [Clostridium sp. D2Q-11]|uniref:Multidrug export protein MepA n=1 Tax=Anaeromonas frigoriresistens TaxID=2683708 RepID=A0A942V068_9FIRM|nr:MATE family efflux transporter [Anaeromonas frigoriresistens]MBS4537662.1 MATE family efflux transporter [Anaeromonas frigoriresistens]